MNRVMVKSVFDAFEYVMDHYYPVGLEEFAERLDSYAVISIQDSHNGGFGFTFCENAFCQGVLTLCFDDIVQPKSSHAFSASSSCFSSSRIISNCTSSL